MLMKSTGISIISALLLVSSAGFAAAEAAKPVTKVDLAKKQVEKITCEDFVGLDEALQPKVIAWAAGYHQGSTKPDKVMVDISGIEKVTPFVVEACKSDPKASFWDKTKAELKKIF